MLVFLILNTFHVQFIFDFIADKFFELTYEKSYIFFT